MTPMQKFLVSLEHLVLFVFLLPSRKPVKKVGAFCWLSLAICIVELLIGIKFGHGMSEIPYIDSLWIMLIVPQFLWYVRNLIRFISKGDATLVGNILVVHWSDTGFIHSDLVMETATQFWQKEKIVLGNAVILLHYSLVVIYYYRYCIEVCKYRVSITS